MRFHRKDWGTDPFNRHLGEVVGSVKEEDVWNVNGEQIKFVEEWVTRSDDVGFEADEAPVGGAPVELCSTTCYACRDVVSVGPLSIRKPTTSANAEMTEKTSLDLAPIRWNNSEIRTVNLDKLPHLQAVLQSLLSESCGNGTTCKDVACANCDVVVRTAHAAG